MTNRDVWLLIWIGVLNLAVEGDSHREVFEAYEEGKKRRLSAGSLIPKRIKYHQFARC